MKTFVLWNFISQCLETVTYRSRAGHTLYLNHSVAPWSFSFKIEELFQKKILCVLKCIPFSSTIMSNETNGL